MYWQIQVIIVKMKLSFYIHNIRFSNTIRSLLCVAVVCYWNAASISKTSEYLSVQL